MHREGWTDGEGWAGLLWISEGPCRPPPANMRPPVTFLTGDLRVTRDACAHMGRLHHLQGARDTQGLSQG